MRLRLLFQPAVCLWDSHWLAILWLPLASLPMPESGKPWPVVVWSAEFWAKWFTQLYIGNYMYMYSFKQNCLHKCVDKTYQTLMVRPVESRRSRRGDWVSYFVYLTMNINPTCHMTDQHGTLMDMWYIHRYTICMTMYPNKTKTYVPCLSKTEMAKYNPDSNNYQSTILTVSLSTISSECRYLI